MAITWKQTVGWLGTVAVLLVVGACGGGAPEPEPEADPIFEETGPSAEERAAAERRRAAAEAERIRRGEEARRAAERSRVQEIIRERVHFDFDKSDVRSDMESVLARKVNVLREYSGIRLRIEGHCDERGSNEYNLALGQRRAEAVRRYLTSHGLDADRFSTISFGEERPAVDAHSEAAWTQNRRSEHIILSLGSLAGD